VSGSNLPAVTSDDNGDVLTVVEGAWAKAAPSGGGAFYVDMTVEGRTYTSEKTYQEIEDAYNAGSVVIGRYQNSYEQDVLVPLAKIGYDSDQSAYCTYFISAEIELYLICLTKTDYPTYEEFI